MPVRNVTLEDAWQMLQTDAAAVLLDVRTKAEWNFVGVPDLSTIGKQVRLVEWVDYPQGTRNAGFVDQAVGDLGPDASVLCLCRSGARSAAAADALIAAGFANASNVVAGFEGDIGADGHRHGGWKDHLPWRQG